MGTPKEWFFADLCNMTVSYPWIGQELSKRITFSSEGNVCLFEPHSIPILTVLCFVFCFAEVKV